MKKTIHSEVHKKIVAYHHAPLFQNEEECYPTDKDSRDIPLYVKICKRADIYDAMASKRSYKEALNQVSAVTEVFRTYVKKIPCCSSSSMHSSKVFIQSAIKPLSSGRGYKALGH